MIPIITTSVVMNKNRNRNYNSRYISRYNRSYRYNTIEDKPCSTNRVSCIIIGCVCVFLLILIL